MRSSGTVPNRRQSKDERDANRMTRAEDFQFSVPLEEQGNTTPTAIVGYTTDLEIGDVLLIKSQIQSGIFDQVQAQNEHSRRRSPMDRPFTLQAAFADIISTKADLYITGRAEGRHR